MGLSEPRTMYGIHSLTPYSRLTGDGYGIIRVIGGASISLTGELVSLTGGSSPYEWSVQDGNITAELSFKPKEIPDFLLQLLLGKAPTQILDDTGNVTALTNVLNASVLDAVTGIASVSVKSGSEDDLKFSRYLVKCVVPTTVDVYASTNLDFFRGADKEYENDLLKITENPLTIAMGAAVEVPGFGVELTGGSGSIAMDIGDTASFEANPPSTIQTDVVIGNQGTCSPEFGAIVAAQKQSDGSMWLFDCYKVKAIGLPFGMEEKAFAEPEITAKLIYDSVKNGIMSIRHIKPATGCN